MNFYQLLTLIFMICTTFRISSISALTKEGMVGGQIAKPHSLKYQVLVQGRTNLSAHYLPICGGGILSEKLVLAAAHCFFDLSNNLRNLTYSVVADLVNLLSLRGIRAEVELLYVPKNRNDYENDISILQLAKKLGVSGNTNLAKLKLPKEKQSFANDIGTIAGYGWVEARAQKSKNSELEKESEPSQAAVKSNFLLKFARVRILDDCTCNAKQSETTDSAHVCGLMISEYSNDELPVCTGDSGSPLVVGETAVGIAIRNAEICGKKVFGCMYTKVSSFLSFIQSIMLGSPTKETKIVRNRPHVIKENAKVKITYH